jgi:hypothetical protein
MAIHEELNNVFHQILEESDEKHDAAVLRRENKKREIFTLLGGKKPSAKDNK